MTGIFEEKSTASRRISSIGGLIGILTAFAVLWAGMTSFLVGIAYYGQKGYWAPVVSGSALVGFGIWLLVKSLGKIRANARPAQREDFY